MHPSLTIEEKRAQWRKWAKDWRIKNPDKQREINKSYYERNKNKISEKSKKWRLDNPHLSAAKERKNYLRKTWQMSDADYQVMLDRQNGVCAICFRPPKKFRLSIDHDHETGVIRGLLCIRCNRAIALFWENPEILKKAATYLEVTLR